MTLVDVSTIQVLTNFIYVAIIGLTSIFVVSLIYSVLYLAYKIRDRLGKQPAEDPLIKELNHLNHILNEAEDIIPKISEEIVKKQQIVNSLKTEYETYSNVPKMSKENVDALRTVLKDVQNTAEHKSVLVQILIGAIFLLLGILIQKYFL